jgi:hypothetical protein
MNGLMSAVTSMLDPAVGPHAVLCTTLRNAVRVWSKESKSHLHGAISNQWDSAQDSVLSTSKKAGNFEVTLPVNLTIAQHSTISVLLVYSF